MPTRRPPSRLVDPVVEALEPKLLYSADLGLGAFVPPADTGAVEQVLSSAQADMAAQDSARQSSDEIVFIDAGVADADTLIDDIRQQAANGRRIEAIVIEADEDGLARITDTLQARQNVAAIHLIGHGESGAMRLGASQLDSQSLMARADEIAQWGAALGEQGDLLLYGCDVGDGVKGQAFVRDMAALTGADVAASDDATGAILLGADWDLEVKAGHIDVMAAISAEGQAQWLQVLASSVPGTGGTAIFPDASGGSSKLVDWDGFALGPNTAAPTATNWTVTDSAQAATRDESIVMGISSNGALSAYMRRDGVWYSIGGGPLVTGGNNTRLGFSVAYESQSDRAVMVWNNGNALSYAVWDGEVWSAIRTYNTPSAPDHMSLVSSPVANQMVLIYSGTNVNNYAMVWQNNAWGNHITLDTTGSNIFTNLADGIDIAAAYESQSGAAVVAYAKRNSANVSYRVFENNAWSNESSVGSPLSSGETKYLTLASDPKSDRIVLSQSTQIASLPYPGSTQHAFAIWDGSAWGNKISAGSSVTAPMGIPHAAVFESQSGQVLAAYYNNTSKVAYRTWSESDGWSAALTGPTLSAVPTNLTLFADPRSDTIMMGVLDSNKAAYLVPWLGSNWGSVKQVTANAGVSQSTAYTWLWDHPGTQDDHQLWMGGSLDNSSGWKGVNAIYNTEVLSLDASTLGAGAATSGSFSHAVNLSAFGATSLGDIAWVSRTVALSPTVSLQRGDILFTTGSGSTLSSRNTITTEGNDLVIFRPDRQDDYSSGTFIHVAKLDAPGAIGSVRGLALVEKATILGDVKLEAGTLLFTQGSANSATTIYQLNLATGLVTALINGASLGLTVSIAGLELVSAPSPLADVTLPQASLLLSLQQAGTVAGLSMSAADVARLTLTRTSVNGTAAGSASLLVQGSSLGIANNSIDTLALVRPATDNSVPVITSNGAGGSAAINVAENTTAVTTVLAFDPDTPGQTLSYSLSGTDASLFEIDSATGVLRFKTAPDHEAPADAGANNVYNVTVHVSDGTYTDTQDLTITVTPVNDNAPLITSSDAAEVAENTTAVLTVTAADADTGTSTALVYSIAGGADAALFQIDAVTGALSFKQAPNFELPLDTAGQNTYTVTVRVSDGALDHTQTITVTVRNVNEAPVITSDGGGATVVLSITEGHTDVTTVQASDPDAGDTLSYSVTGPDAALFEIDAATGVLRFKAAPDYASPLDSNGDNIYSVQVVVQDAGGLSKTQEVLVRVLQFIPPPNSAPVIHSDGGLSQASLTLTEGQTDVTTVQATDAEGDALIYSIAGGADQALFSIDPLTGELRFRTAPSALPAGDADQDNVYQVIVQVTDGSLTTTQQLDIALQAYNRPPVNQLPASFVTNEDTWLTLTGLAVSDPDLGAGQLTVKLSVQHGTLAILSTVAGGLGSGQITAGADGRTLTLQGTQAQINATLAATGGLRYLPDADYTGTDTLTLLSDDLGQNGVPHAPAQTTDSDSATITIEPVDDAPVLSGSGGGISYLENGAPIVIDSAVTLSDADTGIFSGATVRITGSAVAGEDELGFIDQLGITHSWDAATGTLTLSGNASAADYQTALRSITYRNTLEDPSGAPRTITFSVQDAQTAVSVTRNLTVKAVNDAPTLYTSGGEHDFTEGAGLAEQGPAIAIFANTVIDTVEADQQIIGLTLTAAGLRDGHGEVLTIDGTTVTLGAASTGTTTHGIAYTVTVGAGTATISLTGSLTTTEAQDLINGLRYENTVLDDPTPGDRIWTITSLRDDGGTLDGGMDTTTPGIVSTVTVQGINDEPTLSITPLDPTFNEAAGVDTQTPPVQLFQGASIDTIEAGQTISSITVVFGGLLDGLDEVLRIDGSDIRFGASHSGITALHGLSYSVVVEDDAASVTLSGTLTVAQAQALLDSLGYQNTSTDAPSEGMRVVQIAELRDSGGTNTLTLTATAMVTVQAANDAPVISATPTHPTFTEAPGEGAQAAPVVLFTGASVTPVEAGQQITHLRLTVSGLLDGHSERLLIDGSVLTLGGNASGSTANHGLSYTLTVSGGMATLSLTGSLSGSEAAALLNGLAYQNTLSDTPTAGSRVVTLAQVQDNGGTQGAGADTTAPGLSSTIAVVAVADAPRVSQNQLALGTDGSATLTIRVTDVDTASAGLTLVASGIQGGNFFNDRTQQTVGSFSYDDVLAGHIRFVIDGTTATPTYVLQAHDGQLGSAPSRADVTGAFAPILTAPPGPGTQDGDTPGQPAKQESEEDGTAAPPVDMGLTSAQPQAMLGAMATPPTPTVDMGMALYDADAILRTDDTRQGQVLTDTFRPRNAAAGPMATALLADWRGGWGGSLALPQTASEELRRNLDDLRAGLQLQEAQQKSVIATSIALTTGMSVGYVIWLIRGGALLGSMLSAMPAWQMIDPLPVLTRGRARQHDPLDGPGDDQSVEALFDDAGDDDGHGFPADDGPAEPPGGLEPPPDRNATLPRHFDRP